MERASSAVISKPKILPVVLLSSIPLRLVSGGGGGREERKINLRQRTQPYTNDNQRSLSERSTACSNCNKQTSNQSKDSETLAGMIQSPMLILPIVSSKSTKLHSTLYGNQQQHHQPVYYAAKKADESNGGSCRVREISCSFRAHKL